MPYSVISSWISIFFTLAFVGVLIWFAATARSQARKLAIIGLLLQLISGLTAYITPLLYQMAREWTFVITGILSGCLSLTGLILLVIAFLRNDRIVAHTEKSFSQLPVSRPRDIAFEAKPGSADRPDLSGGYYRPAQPPFGNPREQ